MTNQLFMPPTVVGPPYRALVMGSLQPGYYTASTDTRRDEILPSMKALLDGWEQRGARLIGSFDDDLFIVGPPASVDFSIYILFEIPTLDLLVYMLQQVREVTKGVRLDEYIRFEARVGRALFLAADFPREEQATGGRDSREILNDSPPVPASERLVYGPEPLQFGDWRVPESSGGAPVVIIFHGGGWKSTFNLIHAGHMAIALTMEGYRTFNVEYRRVGDPGGGWRGSFDDVLASIDFVLGRSDVDRGEVVLAGHSAGGHLALLAASERKLPVIAMAAGSDLVGWMSDSARAFLGDPSYAAEASPKNRIPLGVRQIFIHGSDDDQVPVRLSAAFVEAARTAGDDAEFVELPGAGHFDMIDPKSAHWPRLVESVRSILG